MKNLVRFGVSLDKDLLIKFDKHIKTKKYSTRSKAIEDLLYDEMIKKDWLEGNKKVAGIISIVYDHHKRVLVNQLLHIQHDYHDIVISSQHIHLTHHNCLEVIVVKGESKKIKELGDRLRSVKGVVHSSMNMTTLG